MSTAQDDLCPARFGDHEAGICILSVGHDEEMHQGAKPWSYGWYDTTQGARIDGDGNPTPRENDVSTEAPEKTDEKVELVQIEFEARWDLTVPLSEFGEASPMDDGELEEWMHENTDKVLSALDLKLIQGDQPIELGFGGVNMYEGTPEALTEWPIRDPRDDAPYELPVPSFVSRMKLDGSRPDGAPVNRWNDDQVIGGIEALQYVLNFCSIGERQKSNLMPYWYELLHAMYARPTLHKFVPLETDEGACHYCRQAEDTHVAPTFEG